MKKTLIVTLMLFVSSISIFARNASDNNPVAESAFNKLFAGASDVKWSTLEGGFIQASFYWSDHRTIAYFSPDAEFLGSVRTLFFNQLPLNVMRAIDNQYGSKSVIEIREITNDEGTSYVVVVDQKEKRIKVSLDSSGGILRKEKVRK